MGVAYATSKNIPGVWGWHGHDGDDQGMTLEMPSPLSLASSGVITLSFPGRSGVVPDEISSNNLFPFKEQTKIKTNKKVAQSKVKRPLSSQSQVVQWGSKWTSLNMSREFLWDEVPCWQEVPCIVRSPRRKGGAELRPEGPPSEQVWIYVKVVVTWGSPLDRETDTFSQILLPVPTLSWRLNCWGQRHFGPPSSNNLYGPHSNSQISLRNEPIVMLRTECGKTVVKDPHYTSHPPPPQHTHTNTLNAGWRSSGGKGGKLK